MSLFGTTTTFTTNELEARTRLGAHIFITVALVIYMLSTFLADWSSGDGYQKAAFYMTTISAVGLLGLAVVLVWRK